MPTSRSAMRKRLKTVTLDFDAVKDEIISDYVEKGLSLRKIAAKYGTSHTSVAKYLSVWEIPCRGSIVRRGGYIRRKGKVYGELLAIAKCENFYPVHWLCMCGACGREVVLRADKLERNKSCGCRRKKRNGG